MSARRTMLVYRPGSLGDTLIALPAIARIRQRHPDHGLTLLTERTPAGSRRVSPWAILEGTGWFDDVHFYVVKPSRARDHWHNLRLALRLRARAFDAVYSLAPPRTHSQLANDARIFKTLVDARRYHAATEPAWPLAVDTQTVEHESLRLLRIVDPHPPDDAGKAFRLAVPAVDQARGARLLHDLGVGDGDMLVGIGPGSARSATTWPVDRFAAVGEALLRQFRPLTLLAIGDAGESGLCEQLCAAWGQRSRNLAGRLSVLGAASVLSRCATFIGNDSGPTHLAAMVGIPCVAIISARNAPGQWAPLGRHHVVLEHRPPCAGCMLDDCVGEANKCLTSIPIRRVVAAAASIIESRAMAGAH